MIVIKVIFGIICGATVGLGLGVAIAVSWGLLAKWTSPSDPSAGAVAIMVIATAPLGLIFGAVLGGFIIAKQPRLFWITVFPIAFLLLGWEITYITLRGMDRPRVFALEIRGTPGAQYVGTVAVDPGVQKKISGKLPATFEFKGFRIDLEVALVDSKGNESISVKTSADGNPLYTDNDSQTGIVLGIKCFGYSETFGGTNRTWSRMSPEDADALSKELSKPDGT